MFAFLDLGIRNPLFKKFFKSLQAYYLAQTEEVTIPFMFHKQSRLAFVYSKTSYSPF